MRSKTRIILHGHGAPQGHDAEVAADTFASDFLVPEAAMRSLAPRVPTIATVAALKKDWHASVAALGRRFHELGAMSEWQYRHFNIELSRRGRSNEPAPLARETSAVLEKTLSALEEEGTTLREIARELAVPVAELRALTFKPHAIAGGGAAKSEPRGTLRPVRK